LSDILSPAVPEDSVQAPVVGRKKKSKKSQLQDDTSSIASGLVSPLVEEKQTSATKPSQPTKTKNGTKKPGEIVKVPEIEHNVEDDEEEEEQGGEEEDAGISANLQKKSERNLTASSIISGLIKDGYPVARESDLMFQPFSINQRQDVSDQALASLRGKLSAKLQHALEEGEAILVQTSKDKFAVRAPDTNFNVLTNVTRDSAFQYLRLRKAVLHRDPLTSFNSKEHPIERWLFSHTNGIPLIKDYSQSGDNENTADEFIRHDDFANAMMRDGSEPLGEAEHYPYPTHESYEDFADGPLDPEEYAARTASLNMEDAERAWIARRKEAEAIEKKLVALMKKNKKKMFLAMG
jgi:hypothetical protein